MSEQFVMSSKKRFSIKPFFDVYEARREQESKNNFLVEIYHLSNIRHQKILDSLEFNQAIFTDTFSFSTKNIVKIIKLQHSEDCSAHFVEKYDKTITEYMQGVKKGRLSEDECLTIIQDILKGLAAILQAGYRPVSVRADNVVRCFNRNPQQRQQIWKIKNVVYSSTFCFQQQNFLTYEQTYCPPEIYSRRNGRDIEYDESEDYVNALLVWSLGVILARLMGLEDRLDSKKKLSLFRDREFNVFDILYIRNQYSVEFLKLLSCMLHFDNKRRMKLKDLFNEPLFSPQLTKGITKKQSRMPSLKPKPKIIVQKMEETEQQFKVQCSLFQLVSFF